MKNLILFLLIFLASCGKPTNKCLSRNEAILRCKADAISRFYPIQVPDYENRICERNYPINSCY